MSTEKAVLHWKDSNQGRQTLSQVRDFCEREGIPVSYARETERVKDNGTYALLFFAPFGQSTRREYFNQGIAGEFFRDVARKKYTGGRLVA
ncbi:MAG: hypothetical protein ABH817_02450 [archaeon]